MTTSPLRIALVNRIWDLVVQRFHHWDRQGRAHGHDVQIFTTARPLVDGLRHPERYRAPNIHRVPRNLLDGLRARLGDGTHITKDRRLQRFEQFIHREVVQAADPFDVMLYSSIPTPHFVARPARGLFVYDCLDEWTAFSEFPPEMIEWERRIASQADLILAVSQPLADRLAAEHGAERVLLLPNGCEFDHFAAHTHAPRASQQAIIGYTGSLHEWFDWALLTAVAEALPEATIRIVGPVTYRPATLPPNVELLGYQPYARLPEINAGYDVCLIPFRNATDRPLIESVSPIKLYEYLAAGRPVVSTPMPDVQQLAEPGVVRVARHADEFVQAVRASLAEARDPALVARRQQVAQQHSWASRWQTFEARLRELRPVQGG